MAINYFRLNRITLVGQGVPNAEIQFTTGLNVISGPSDTGKTFIVQCIDYMLGGKQPPKPIPESAQYETVRLGICPIGSDEEILLERAMRGGNALLIVDGEAERKLTAAHSAGEKDSISAYLLEMAGLVGRMVRTNSDGKTRPVSFRDLAKLILIDEEIVISEVSPILTGQYTSATAESAIFRLLLTGIDDSAIVANEDPKVAKGRQAGKVEITETLLNQAKNRMATLQLAGDIKSWEGELKKVDTLYEAAQKELAVEQQSAANLEKVRRDELTSLRRLESRAGVLKELQGRFVLLRKQYLSDLQRLESIAETSARLGQMNEERCPLCGAPAGSQAHEHQKPDHAPQDVSQSCFAEAAKIKILLTDLHLTEEDNDAKILELNKQADIVKERVRLVASELGELLKPRVEIALLRLNESQKTRDIYRDAIDLNRNVDGLQKLLTDLINLKVKKGTKLASANIRTDEAEDFSTAVETLLRAWHFPGLNRVTFSEVDQDIVISGKKRASHGKGVRAIAHAAFNLALLQLCMGRKMPHPGFVLIDSPLVVYRKPDPGENGFTYDVKEAFYRSIAKEFTNAQVIIFENEDPPQDLSENANLIHFTGAAHGRWGFIPAKKI